MEPTTERQGFFQVKIDWKQKGPRWSLYSKLKLFSGFVALFIVVFAVLWPRTAIKLALEVYQAVAQMNPAMPKPDGKPEGPDPPKNSTQKPQTEKSVDIHIRTRTRTGDAVQPVPWLNIWPPLTATAPTEKAPDKQFKQAEKPRQKNKIKKDVWPRPNVQPIDENGLGYSARRASPECMIFFVFILSPEMLRACGITPPEQYPSAPTRGGPR